MKLPDPHSSHAVGGAGCPLLDDPLRSLIRLTSIYLERLHLLVLDSQETR